MGRVLTTISAVPGWQRRARLCRPAASEGMAQRGCPGAALYSNAGGKLRHVTVFSGMQRIRVGISEPGAATC